MSFTLLFFFIKKKRVFLFLSLSLSVESRDSTTETTQSSCSFRENHPEARYAPTAAGADAARSSSHAAVRSSPPAPSGVSVLRSTDLGLAHAVFVWDSFLFPLVALGIWQPLPLHVATAIVLPVIVQLISLFRSVICSRRRCRGLIKSICITLQLVQIFLSK